MNAEYIVKSKNFISISAITSSMPNLYKAVTLRRKKSSTTINDRTVAIFKYKTSLVSTKPAKMNRPETPIAFENTKSKKWIKEVLSLEFSVSVLVNSFIDFFW
tara:strand:+ start:144 stop:452 length:309 start_codon:yes stop_codon:yes gene_type:complete